MEKLIGTLRDAHFLIEIVILSSFMGKWLQETLQKVVQQFYPEMKVESSKLVKVPMLA